MYWKVHLLNLEPKSLNTFRREGKRWTFIWCFFNSGIWPPYAQVCFKEHLIKALWIGRNIWKTIENHALRCLEVHKIYMHVERWKCVITNVQEIHFEWNSGRWLLQISYLDKEFLRNTFFEKWEQWSKSNRDLNSLHTLAEWQLVN